MADEDVCIFVTTDAAENNVFEALQQEYGEQIVVRKKLDLGDVAFCRSQKCNDAQGSAESSKGGSETMLFELKRGDDWASSIKDGRYKEQSTRFRTYASQIPENSSITLTYILSGPTPGMTGQTRGMLNKALTMSGVMTQVRDYIDVLRVPTEQDARLLLSELFKRFKTREIGPERLERSQKVVVGLAGGGFSGKRDNLEQGIQAQQVAMLTTFPGISVAKATAIVGHCGESSISKGLCRLLATEGTVADITFQKDANTKKRRIGNVLESRLREVFGTRSQKMPNTSVSK